MFDLFLSVYNFLDRHTREMLRYGRSTAAEELWSPHFAKSAFCIVQDNQSRQAIEQVLKSQVPTFDSGLADPQRSVPVLAGFLRAAEESLAEYLMSYGLLSHPSPPVPHESSTIVLKQRGQRFFGAVRDEYRHKAPPPPPAHSSAFEEALGLTRLYVVPPLRGNDLFYWTISAMPERLQHLVESVGSTKLGLMSFPHARDDVYVWVDERNRRFIVPAGLGPNETAILNAIDSAVTHTQAADVVLLLCPELTGSDNLRARFRNILAHDKRIALVCPGSQHVSIDDETLRNRCLMLGPGGTDMDAQPDYHDKLTQFSLPGSALRYLGYSELADAIEADPHKEILENIDISHRRIALWDIAGLGRVALLICLDILDPYVRRFLLRHEIDHVLVLAMSPKLERFANNCADLGRRLDAGVYVVNSCHWQDSPQDAAYIYVPYKPKQGGPWPIRRCNPADKGAHLVCLRVFDLMTSETTEILAT
jgi:hypothetical protein